MDSEYVMWVRYICYAMLYSYLRVRRVDDPGYVTFPGAQVGYEYPAADEGQEQQEAKHV